MSAHGLLEVRPAAGAYIAECRCGRAYLRGRERDARDSLDRHVRSFAPPAPPAPDEPGLFGVES